MHPAPLFNFIHGMFTLLVNRAAVCRQLQGRSWITVLLATKLMNLGVFKLKNSFSFIIACVSQRPKPLPLIVSDSVFTQWVSANVPVQYSACASYVPVYVHVIGYLGMSREWKITAGRGSDLWSQNKPGVQEVSALGSQLSHKEATAGRRL